MNCLTKTDHIMPFIAGYQYLSGTMVDAEQSAHLLKHGYGCDAHSAGEVEAAYAHGINANDIYFTQHHKQQRELELCFSKCRFVTGTLEEMQLLDEVASKQLSRDRLEVIGIQVIPDDYDDSCQYGFRAGELASLTASFRKLQHISIRGCFIAGAIDSLAGSELPAHYRRCYETAKQVSTAIPCGMSYLCFGTCTKTIYQSSIEQPEVFAQIHKTAAMIRHQNDTAFYAKLLVL